MERARRVELLLEAQPVLAEAAARIGELDLLPDLLVAIPVGDDRPVYLHLLRLEGACELVGGVVEGEDGDEEEAGEEGRIVRLDQDRIVARLLRLPRVLVRVLHRERVAVAHVHVRVALRRDDGDLETDGDVTVGHVDLVEAELRVPLLVHRLDLAVHRPVGLQRRGLQRNLTLFDQQLLALDEHVVDELLGVRLGHGGLGQPLVVQLLDRQTELVHGAVVEHLGVPA